MLAIVLLTFEFIGIETHHKASQKVQAGWKLAIGCHQIEKGGLCASLWHVGVPMLGVGMAQGKVIKERCMLEREEREEIKINHIV